MAQYNGGLPSTELPGYVITGGIMAKLDMQHKHILKLIDRDADHEGWTSVSEKLYPVLSKNISSELATFEEYGSGYRAKLTAEGRSVVDAMKWL